MATFGSHPQKLFIFVKGQTCDAHLLVFLDTIAHNTIDVFEFIGWKVGFCI